VEGYECCFGASPVPSELCSVQDRTLMATIPTKPGSVLEQHTALIPRYKVLVHNDDVNSMDYVVNTLMRVFRFERSICERIMLKAHHDGVALCAIEPLEQAELHRDQLISYSLVSTIEKE
jgi:ATP-dependent Clp protease adaptor protein ClpS